MNAARDDRRSKRTRQLLGNALVELMLEKRFEDITVQAILDRADVERSTFYAHYTDKENLLISQIAQVIRQLDQYAAQIGHQRGQLLPSLELFRHIQEHRRFIPPFVWGHAAKTLTRDFRALLGKIVEQNLVSQLGDSSSVIPLAVAARFVASAFLMLVLWWFEEDMRHSPEQMNDMFQELVMPGIHALLT